MVVVHTSRSPPSSLLESLKGQVKQLIHVSNMRRPSHLPGLQGERGAGQNLNAAGPRLI